MKAKLAPLKCHGFFVTELMVAANPEYDKKKPNALLFGDLQIDSTAKPVSKKFDGRLWQVILQMQQNVGPDKNTPYNFSVTVVGHFEVHPKYPVGKAQQLVEINGSSILYSSARQILRDAMHNGPFPALDLPTVSFFDAEPDLPAKKIVAEASANCGDKTGK